MKKENIIKKTIIIMLIFLSMPMVLADTIENKEIIINIYNISKIPANDSLINSEIVMRVEVINPQYSGDTQNFTFTIFNNSIVNVNKNFNLLFIKNESVDLNTVEKYAVCLTEKSQCEVAKGQMDTGYTKCSLDLMKCRDRYEGENSTKCDDKLSTCKLNLKEKDLDLTSKNKEITTLNKEKEDTKNSKYFFGFIGIVLGIIGFLLYEGRIGKGDPKDKSMGEFNKSQAG